MNVFWGKRFDADTSPGPQHELVQHLDYDSSGQIVRAIDGQGTPKSLDSLDSVFAFSGPVGVQDYAALALSLDFYASEIDSGPSSISLLGEPITSNDLFPNEFSTDDIQFFDVASQLDYLQSGSVFDTLYEQELERAYDQGLMEQRILERQEQEFGEFLSNVSFGAYYAADIGTDFSPVVGGLKSVSVVPN